MNTPIRTIAATIAAAGMLFAAGCATTDAETATEPARGTNTPTSTDEAAAAEAELEAEIAELEAEIAAEESATAIGPFGDTVEWDSGLQVTVSAPKPYDFEYAGDPNFEPEASMPAHLIFDVTIVNGTAEPYDPAELTHSLQSANTEAADESYMLDFPYTAVLPGREVVFQIAYGVPDVNDLVMEVTPDWESEAAYFVTKGNLP